MTPRFFRSHYEPSRPLEARGGIKARNRRGRFGENWWARCWIEVLESFDIGARLSRGRAYARRGQVLCVDIQQGLVTAVVQGSRVRPYRVEIRVKTVPQAKLDKLAEPLRRRPILAARLLSGQMPEEMPEIFREAGLSLFPERRNDLKSDCSCPDWSNPCKHIAAVYYLLGEEFDRDPFLIFTLRGIDREALVALAVGDELAHGLAAGDEAGEPIPAEPGRFWGAAEWEEVPLGEARMPTIHAALPRQLGGFPFWRGEQAFLAAMEEIYRRASAIGLQVFLGRQAADPTERVGYEAGRKNETLPRVRRRSP